MPTGLLDALDLGPANIFGSSSGAAVALDLVARHPRLVRTVVAHEPPAHYLLPDAEALKRQHDELIDVYHRDGIAPAMRKVVTKLARTGSGGSSCGASRFLKVFRIDLQSLFASL